MYQNMLNIVEYSDFAYAIVQRKTQNILASNKLFKTFYNIDANENENSKTLGDIFPNDINSIIDGLEILSRLKYIKLLSIKSNKNSGEVFECDIEFRFFNEDEDVIYLLIKEKTQNDELIRRCIDLSKKIEMDQQYFDVMQEFSKDLFFRINLKRKTMVHRGDISNFYGLIPEVGNYPESMLKNGLIHPEDLPNYMIFANNLMNGIGGVFETRVQFKDRTFEWYRLQGKPIFDNDGIVIEMVGKSENIQKLVNASQNTDKDLLTEVLTKTSFEVLVGTTLEFISETDNFALLVIDIDGFKEINEEFGYIFGDFLLQIAGKRLVNCIRRSDKIGRVGVNQFAILFNHVPNNEIVLNRAEIIRQVLNRAMSNGEHSCEMTVTIGISLFPQDASKYNKIFDNCIKTIEKARGNGNNNIAFYE